MRQTQCVIMKNKRTGRFSKFYLCQQLFAFKKHFMKTRLYNIFKSKNAAKLTNPIIESSYKVVLDKILVTIKRPLYFL